MSHWDDDLDKWISVKSKSGKRDMVYHTIYLCQHLISASNVRPPTDSELMWHEPNECADCRKIRERMVDNIDSCSDCGGDIGIEVVGDEREWVCEDCGKLVVDNDFVVENQEREEEDGDVEVME